MQLLTVTALGRRLFGMGMHKTLGILALALTAVVFVGHIGSYHASHKCYHHDPERPTRLYTVKGSKRPRRRVKKKGGQKLLQKLFLVRSGLTPPPSLLG